MSVVQRATKQPKNVNITKRPHQVSATGGELSNYLLRQLPIWNNPQWLDASIWRAFVHRQPIAILCRDAITSYLLSLDWSIVARDSEQQDEYKEDIKYYTRLLERGNAYYSDMDFASHVEWIVKDLFDLPFGGASEIGREFNSPTGKVVWIRPLDGGTLAPTLDVNYPVVQHYPSFPAVVFPKDFISRVYLSPRTEITREGWGFAPPERIYLAMEMLNRGDSYYSQLLLNTPEAGMLDLGDMEGEVAKEWVKSMQDLLNGTNPWKVPVLYEHTTDVKWIPFGKLPNDIMYDNITNRYITILTAGYGISPSDIGFSSSSNGGETLAGTIRQERRSAKSGKALAKTKLKIYFEKILPEYLKFHWVDFDDEKNVAKSRARMANANADSLNIQNQLFTPEELRRQAMADGMITISVPEKIDRSTVEWPDVNTLRYVGKQTNGDEGKKNSNSVGDKKTPGGGGQGEVIPQQVISRNRQKIEVSISKAVYQSNRGLGALLNSVRDGNEVNEWEKKFDESVVGKSQMDLVTESVISDTYNSLLDTLDSADWVDTVSKDISYILANHLSNTVASTVTESYWKKAEEEFIAGSREDISLTDEELLYISSLTEKKDLFLDVKKSLVESLIPKIILVSKSAIMDHKYPLDTKDQTDNNNLRLAREIATKVYQLFPVILTEIQQSIIN